MAVPTLSKRLRYGFGSMLALACIGAAPAQPIADILIRGGTIYSGDAAPFVGDVLVTGDRISYVGPKAPQGARKTIEAKGLIVSPGFIDPHAHVDEALNSPDPVARMVLPFLTQGVTTAVLGADGTGGLDTAKRLGWTRTAPVGINYATYIGLEPVRSKVMGPSGRESNAAQLDEMRGLVARAMCEGAIGMSTGLYYPPQSFATLTELTELSKEVAKRGGIYDSHIRDESNTNGGWRAAIKEAIDIGRGSGVPIHIAHIKASGVEQGKAAEVIAMVEAARAEGIDVTADQYPWTAGATGLDAVMLPPYAVDGGYDAFRQRMKDPATAAKIKAEMRQRLIDVGGPQTLSLYTMDRSLWATRLDQLAAQKGQDPVDVALDNLLKDPAAVLVFNMRESDVVQFMRRPWVMTSSDAAIPHPRYFGSFSRKFAKYVRADKVISVRDFIDRSTALTADTLHIKDRGRLAAGKFADIILFDPATFAERATFEAPELFSIGMQAVLVNGQLAIEKGLPIGTAAGRPLVHVAPAGTCPAR